MKRPLAISIFPWQQRICSIWGSHGSGYEEYSLLCCGRQHALQYESTEVLEGRTASIFRSEGKPSKSSTKISLLKHHKKSILSGDVRLLKYQNCSFEWLILCIVWKGLILTVHILLFGGNVLYNAVLCWCWHSSQEGIYFTYVVSSCLAFLLIVACYWCNVLYTGCE
jgi:hypothetical protein